MGIYNLPKNDPIEICSKSIRKSVTFLQRQPLYKNWILLLKNSLTINFFKTFNKKLHISYSRHHWFHLMSFLSTLDEFHNILILLVNSSSTKLIFTSTNENTRLMCNCTQHYPIDIGNKLNDHKMSLTFFKLLIYMQGSIYALFW